MDITIAGSTIAGMFTATAFCTALHIILLLVWLKKTGAKAMPFFVGAGIFILFALILEQILHTFCMVLDNPVSRVIKSSVVLYTLYGGLAAGVFEETGRFVAFKVMKSRASRETAITYGIGHGGIESILVAGMNMTVYGVIALLVNRGGLSAAIPIIGDEATAQMVVASIAAIDLSAFSHKEFIIPLLSVCVVGALATYLYLNYGCKKVYPAYRDEAFLSLYGMLTGTASTGVILLREIDQRFETPASNNLVYHQPWAILFGFPIMLLLSVAPKGLTQAYLTFGILAVLLIALNVISLRKSIFRTKKK